MSFSWNVTGGEKNQFGFRFKAIKRLWCSADISILVNGTPSFEKLCFSINAFVLCWHKVFSLIAITFLYTSVYSYITASSVHM